MWANKDVHYDYTNLAMRYDITYLDGPQVPFITLLNFTSLWLGDNLYMITWATPLDNTPFCIELQMGFGLMRPSWFQQETQLGIVWNTKRSDSFHDGYYPSLMGTIDAGQGLDLPFTYYSAFNNATSDDPNFMNGAPWLMHAPSPSGMVVNEYYNFQNKTYAKGDPIFNLPGSPTCVPTKFFAKNAQDAAQFIRSAHPSFANLPLSELYLSNL